ncbi:MAG: zinc ABC transporter substrate-binding protein [Deferribacteraceae bacterium]|jgi:zinc transport system substrate-binding protein|nr:zinc ABC transporter substrate-binding protein [Deferribacteraceae bacterium]
MKRLIIITFTILFSLTAYALSPTKNRVTVSIPPQKYLVEKIAGKLVDVNVIVPAGADPHSFAPKTAQIEALAKSDLYLAIGFPFEGSMLPQVAKSMKIKIVQTSNGISLIEEEHEGELDPHVWTSPKSMLIVAENTYRALVESYPAWEDSFDKNYTQLKSEITQYDTDLAAAIAKSNKIFMVYHPAYGYLSRDYGLTQLEVEHEGKEPKARELAELIGRAKSTKIRLFIVSPQQSSAAAQTIAKELGLQLTVIDNLNEDWGATMRTVCEAFAK